LVANAHVLAQYLATIGPSAFDLLIVDECYQLDASNYMTVSDLAPRTLMIGDPGQLPPVQPMDTANLEAADHKMHRSSPDYVLDRFPSTPVHRLPVTRRLTRDTTAFVQPAFYPDLPFASIVADADRRLTFPVAGLEPVLDDVLDALARGESIVALTLPGAPPTHMEVDPELASVSARLVQRLFQRQGTWRGKRVLERRDVGCIDPNVVTGAAMASELRSRGVDGVTVDTVEKWQGLQAPIMVVRHPLSRIGRPTPFDLEKGRWCVSLSRHLLGCVIVARESVGEAIDTYLHRSDTAAAGADDTTWSGYVAHRRIWNRLRELNRIYRYAG